MWVFICFLPPLICLNVPCTEVKLRYRQMIKKEIMSQILEEQ